LEEKEKKATEASAPEEQKSREEMEKNGGYASMEQKPHPPQETGTMRATFAFNVLFSYYANINTLT